MNSTGSREFEIILRDGITAAKNGQRRLAQSLLRQAILLNGSDARPYLWLSATTDDPYEQREYLEQAVVIEPGNAAARRGLALLTGKLDRSNLLDEGAAPIRAPSPEVKEVRGEAFLCPKCGGRMLYSPASGGLVCEYCGNVKTKQPGGTQDTGQPASRAEQVLDFVMPTPRGHRWAEAQQRLSCEQCGAITLLPPGEKTNQCSYCGSNHFVVSPEAGELVDPQGIVLMKIEAQEASRRVKAWLGRGLFAPDDLIASVRHLELRPAYYSCWTFDGALEVRWTCEVKEGSGRYARWEPRSGVETRFFNDVLVPGVKALGEHELESVEPFDLKEIQEFKPETLAGWPALVYDRSLSDASLLAREKVSKRLRLELLETIEVGREKRDLSTGSGNWSGITFQHILLPLWIGTYHYGDKAFHLLVNGQTGKVGGSKPRDRVKIFLTGLILGLAMLLLVLLLLWWRSPGL